MGHLEGQTNNKLHKCVEHDVLHVDVDELIGEEAPDFVASAGVVDEVGAYRRLACQSRFSL